MNIKVLQKDNFLYYISLWPTCIDVYIYCRYTAVIDTRTVVHYVWNKLLRFLKSHYSTEKVYKNMNAFKEIFVQYSLRQYQEEETVFVSLSLSLSV